MNLISVRVASLSLSSILGLTIIFHVLVLIGTVPYEVVWGGRLTTRREMFVFETVSILLNVMMLTAVLNHQRLIFPGYVKIGRVVMWIMFVLFTANTIGNLFSLNELESIIFTPITLVLALQTLRLALHRA
ncbi:MAG TPA: hypothetical protein VD927_03290 [Chryseosolibacter sp.]|nr:hypothetical protein [Chryseosolibacter sp.]